MSAFKRRPGGLPLIHGHRGVRGPVAENTMRAFQRAQEERADGVELDVRSCKTGEVVVFHDETLRRMSDGFDSRAIAQLSWAELSRIEIQGEKIPRLRDVLDWIEPTGLLLNVEMKREVPSRIRLVHAVVRDLSAKSSLRDRLLVSCFDPFMLAPLNALLPRIPKALLFHSGYRRYQPWSIALRGPFQAAHPEFVMVTEKLGTKRIVNAWTVNDEAQAIALAQLGVDGLITDAPARIRAALEGMIAPAE